MTDRLFLTFSEDGEHIRKWSREPFEGAVEYVAAPEERRDALDEYDYDEDSIWCDRCQGSGIAECYCGGDQCYCKNNGEMECLRCDGEGRFVPKPGQLEREAEFHRQMQEVIARASTPPAQRGRARL